MRANNDKKTVDLLGDTCDLAGERGPAPKVGRPRKYASDKERAADFRARNGLRAVTVNIPADLAERFDEWAKAKGKNKSKTIARLIETQLLRPR